MSWVPLFPAREAMNHLAEKKSPLQKTSFSDCILVDSSFRDFELDSIFSGDIVEKYVENLLIYCAYPCWEKYWKLILTCGKNLESKKILRKWNGMNEKLPKIFNQWFKHHLSLQLIDNQIKSLIFIYIFINMAIQVEKIQHNFVSEKGNEKVGLESHRNFHWILNLWFYLVGCLIE